MRRNFHKVQIHHRQERRPAYSEELLKKWQERVRPWNEGWRQIALGRKRSVVIVKANCGERIRQVHPAGKGFQRSSRLRCRATKPQLAYRLNKPDAPARRSWGARNEMVLAVEEPAFTCTGCHSMVGAGTVGIL